VRETEKSRVHPEEICAHAEPCFESFYVKCIAAKAVLAFGLSIVILSACSLRELRIRGSSSFRIFLFWSDCD